MDTAMLLAAFVLVSLPMCVCDLRVLRVPNRLVAVSAVVVGPAAVAVRGFEAAAGGALFAGLVLLCARRLSGGALGGGDVKYGLVLGAATGATRAGGVLLGAAGAAAVVILLRGGGRLPFAPVLFLAAAVSLAVEVLGGLR